MREKDITGGKSKADMDLGMETRFLKIKAQMKRKRGWRLKLPTSQRDVDAIKTLMGLYCRKIILERMKNHECPEFS